MSAYRLSGEAKLEGICEFLDNLIDNECKFLIFAHHHSVLDGLEDYIVKKKL